MIYGTCCYAHLIEVVNFLKRWCLCLNAIILSGNCFNFENFHTLPVYKKGNYFGWLPKVNYFAYTAEYNNNLHMYNLEEK